MNKEVVLKKIKQFLFIALGVLLLDIGYYFFYSPINLVAGGVTGLSIIFGPLLDKINMSQSTFLYIAEGICLLLGLILIGKDFFFKTIVASILAPTFIFIFEHFFEQDFILKTVQNKELIALLVASVLSGLGIGICLKNNGSTGGLDVIQKSLSKYLHVPYSIAMYSTDWIIVTIGGFNFVNGVSYNFEMAIYGIISVYLVAYLIDVITLNARSRRTAYIITSKPLEVKELIFNLIGRGVTECDVRGGYTNENKVMLICVMNKNESYRLGEAIKNVDYEAFTFYASTKEVFGEYERNPKQSS